MFGVETQKPVVKSLLPRISFRYRKWTSRTVIYLSYPTQYHCCIKGTEVSCRGVGGKGEQPSVWQVAQTQTAVVSTQHDPEVQRANSCIIPTLSLIPEQPCEFDKNSTCARSSIFDVNLTFNVSYSEAQWSKVQPPSRERSKRSQDNQEARY